MRVAKSDTIAGLPAPVARSLARLFRGGEFVQEVGDSLLLKNGIDDTDDDPGAVLPPSSLD
jgi:hypothetical protein